EIAAYRKFQEDKINITQNQDNIDNDIQRNDKHEIIQDKETPSQGQTPGHGDDLMFAFDLVEKAVDMLSMANQCIVTWYTLTTYYSKYLIVKILIRGSGNIMPVMILNMLRNVYGLS